MKAKEEYFLSVTVYCNSAHYDWTKIITLTPSTL